jgi:hypothetical protein
VEFFVIVAYGNGTQTVFSGFDTLLSGPTPSGAVGLERAGMGAGAGLNAWFTSQVWTSQSFVNGSGTATTAPLPMPMSIQRFTGASTTQPWAIGANLMSSGRSWNGPIGEVIAVNTSLTTTQRQKAEGYLAHKWGLTGNLSSSPLHPYKSTPPTP